MTVYLISFGDSDDPYSKTDRHYIEQKKHRDYKKELERLMHSASKVGMNNLIRFDFNWLKETKEYSENKLLFSKRPYGWAFKPLSILFMLNKVNSGDVVLWSDSNHHFIRYPERIVDYAIKNNIYACDHSPRYYSNKCWTHRDTFISMGCDESRYWMAPQMHANVVGVCKNSFTMNFVEEWKNYTCDYNTNGINKKQNFPCFKEHRDDQSIFSILVEKYNITYQTHPGNSLVEHTILFLEELK